MHFLCVGVQVNNKIKAKFKIRKETKGLLYHVLDETAAVAAGG